MCKSTCAECLTTNKNYCTACEWPDAPFLVNGECTLNCPDGTYGNYTTHKCESCISPCQNCISSTECTSCLPLISTNLLYYSSCIDTCPAEVTVQIGSECFDCDDNCATCQDAVESCASCKDDWILLDSTKVCVESCPIGTHI